MRFGEVGKRRTLTWLTGALLAALAIMGGNGCTRRYYRKCADKEVNALLAEKDQLPNAKIVNFHPYPDPLARFADPTNPDRPPMPPDDPAAKAMAPNPQRPPRKAGIARVEGTGYLNLLAFWDAHNRALRGEPVEPVQFQSGIILAKFMTENPKQLPEPSWAGKQPESGNAQGGDKKAFDVGPPPRMLPDGMAPQPFLLTLEQAVEMGLINSREFQDRREDLYLSALPVTLERFAFAPQAFAFEEAIRERTGRQTDVGQHNRWRANSDLGFTKLFSTGALLLVSFANRSVVELTGKGPHTVSVSDLNLDLVQPLLRGGGRAVTLEPLTQAERNLLYEVRSYARFRKEFCQYVTGGGTLGTPLVFTSGLGRNAVSVGAARLAAGNPATPLLLPGAAGSIDLGTGITPAAQGYLPTLVQAAAVTNATKNVKNLEKILELFKAYEEGGEVGSLQVGQVEQDLLRGKTTELQEKQRMQDALDAFKLQLGLPVNLPLALDDEAVRPIARQLENLEQTIQQAEELANQVERTDFMPEAAKLRERIRDFFTKSPLARGTKVFQKNMPLRWGAWEKFPDNGLEKKLEGMRLRRRALLELKLDLEQEEKKLPQKEHYELTELDTDIPYGDLEFALRRYLTQPWKNLPAEKDQRKLHDTLFREVRKAFDQIVGEVVQERLALIRPAWPGVAPMVIGGVDLINDSEERAYEVVAEVALSNRLDLMNARALVNDAWRQIAIFANSLLGVFNVGYHMDSTTPPGQAKPLVFQPNRTRHQLFLNAELPLVRLAERNNYRASLIAYQRARRGLQEAEDLVVAQVRTELRQLRFLAQNFIIQQRAVELAYTQLDSSMDTFRAPPQVGAGAQGAGSIAALTQQLLNAQRNLPAVQNQLYAIWINYQVQRQQLYLDLELMLLDFRGVWTDEYADHRPRLSPQGGSQPQPIEQGLFQQQGRPRQGPVEAPRLLPPAEVLPALSR